MRQFVRRDWTSAAVLVCYVLVAFVYWGARLLPHPGRSYVGTPNDPQIFIWSFAWWPHAIAHGVNPFYTHSIWAPSGVNLAWTTSVPGVALVFAPLTWLFGAVGSYNVATVLMPGLAAWTAFLLCRHLTRSLWPSLVGGYLFGFSAYMVGQIGGGHMHMDSVFLLPLVALVVLRFVEAELDGLGLALRLGPLLALQLTLSTENTFTFSLALVTAIVLGFLFVPTARRRLVALVLPLAASYALAAVVAAPLVYYALSGFNSGSVNAPAPYTTDLLNLFVPTQRLLSGGHLASTISQHFAGNDNERDGYLGWPSLVIAGLFAARRWRTPTGRFLFAGMLVGIVASFGTWLQVDGHKVVTMPWEHVGYLPLFDNVPPARLMLFVVLITAIIVALWTRAARGWIRIVLPTLAILAFIPDPRIDAWKTAAPVPPFFGGANLTRCVAPNENVLIFPQAKHGNAMLWQVAAGFRFRMPDGYVEPGVPADFMTTPAVARVANRRVTWPDLVAFAKAKHVTTVLVDPKQSEPWQTILRPLAPPREVGDMLIYRFDKKARC